MQEHELQVMMMTVTMSEVLVGCRRPIRDAGLVHTVAVCLVLLCKIHSRAQRIDMDMLTHQIAVLRIGHEAMQNTANQTKQALLGLQVQHNIG